MADGSVANEREGRAGAVFVHSCVRSIGHRPRELTLTRHSTDESVSAR